MAAAGWLGVGLAWPGGREVLQSGAHVTVFLLLAAFLEEIAVRGYPFQVLAEALGPGVAVVATSIVFAVLHGANPGVGWTAIWNTFLAGILLGIMYWKTMSLWLVTGAHFTWNWTMGVAAGMPVSGLDLGVSGVESTVRGPELLTGGAYGPEGGWLLATATLAAIIWAASTPRLSRDPAVLALRPLPVRRLRGSEVSNPGVRTSVHTVSEAK
jgi:hypothetical protein